MPNFSGIWNLKQQVQAIAAGRWTGLPELYAWGRNNSGQIGNKTVASLSSPVQLGSPVTWYQVSSGGAHTAAIAEDGTLWSWGDNGSGRLGLDNDEAVNFSSPVQVGALTNWEQVSAGGTSTGSVKTDGTLWMWGNNFRGRVGDNSTVNRSSPVQIGALTSWAQVSLFSQHTLAVKTSGTLWAWGLNITGRLGDNSTVTRSSPVQIGALTNWAQVAIGGPDADHSAAVKTDGTLWTWGPGASGELGDGTTTNRSSPVQVGGLTTWAQVTTGNARTFATTTSGELYAWGNNLTGRLGVNTSSGNESNPVQIGALTNWLQVSAGTSQTLAVKTDGTLWGWGENGDGEIGDGTIVDRSSPVQVGTLTNWTEVSAGGSHTAAIFQGRTN